MSDTQYLLGYDVGSSSVKACVIDAQSGAVLASATSPDRELPMNAPQPGWAEQDPDTWWEHVVRATRMLGEQTSLQNVAAVGISYQMHGLVAVDEHMHVVRPSIIWCDSRAVDYGRHAFSEIGKKRCLDTLLNSPGNFTASKLAWVKDNEPDLFARIAHIMLPGDYVAYKLSGACTTTTSGLSEAILWDFKQNKLARFVLDYFGFSQSLIPDIVDNFAADITVSEDAASQLGIPAGTPVAYRGGDQPNNALSLNVLNPGEIAATAGTSGVVYGVSDAPEYDPHSRVNTFVHVNHRPDTPRYGVLLCVSGTGICNSWLKHNVVNAGGTNLDYKDMNDKAASVAIGSEGLVCLPFGNGAERPLGDRDIAAHFEGVRFNTHTTAHLLRASQEGIAFALNYGLSVMKDMGVAINTVRAGQANMFLSPIFCDAFANTTGARIELYNTDGAQGAARGGGIGAGIYADEKQAFNNLAVQSVITPDDTLKEQYHHAYTQWVSALSRHIDATS
jgi:xylulokinase